MRSNIQKNIVYQEFVKLARGYLTVSEFREIGFDDAGFAFNEMPDPVEGLLFQPVQPVLINRNKRTSIDGVHTML